MTTLEQAARQALEALNDIVKARNYEVGTPVEAVAALREALEKPAPVAHGDAEDAARYRLLRRGQHWSVIDGIGDTLRSDDLDAAIDAALAAQGGK